MTEAEIRREFGRGYAAGTGAFIAGEPRQPQPGTPYTPWWYGWGMGHGDAKHCREVYGYPLVTGGTVGK